VISQIFEKEKPIDWRKDKVIEEGVNQIAGNDERTCAKSISYAIS
jgi:hypothetical protein